MFGFNGQQEIKVVFIHVSLIKVTRTEFFCTTIHLPYFSQLCKSEMDTAVIRTSCTIICFWHQNQIANREFSFFILHLFIKRKSLSGKEKQEPTLQIFSCNVRLASSLIRKVRVLHYSVKPEDTQMFTDMIQLMFDILDCLPRRLSWQFLLYCFSCYSLQCYLHDEKQCWDDTTNHIVRFKCFTWTG